MAWLGFITLITIYWCVFVTLVTGRLGWTLLCIWCAPILCMCLSYRPDMEINGLMVLICILMFFLCRRSLTDVRMWNLKMRKKHSIISGFLYVLCLAFLSYSVWQAQTLGYIWNFQDFAFKKWGYLGSTLYFIPIFLLALPLSQMLYNSLDRVCVKEKELILLACKFFIANEQGAEWGFWKGHFLDGINNGINYHFRMTPRTYYMIRKEKTLLISVKTGLLGGLYVVENPCPDHGKKTRRRDRKNMKLGVFGCVLVMAAGIWLFWFL